MFSLTSQFVCTRPDCIARRHFLYQAIAQQFEFLVSILKSERILKITDLYKLHVSLFMFDLQSGALPTSFKQYIPRDANDYTSTIITRQHDNIQRQRPRTTFSSKLPKLNFIKIWNSIDESTRNKKNRHIFKCILTKQFIAQYKTNVKCTNRRCRDCYNNNI